MLNENTKIELNAYASDIVKFAQIGIGDRNRRRTYPSGRTVRGAIEASGNLRKSIGYFLKVYKNSFQLNIEADDYWKAVDQGRKAAYIPIAPIVKWIRQKRIKIRDKDGRFVGMDDSKRLSLAIAISKAAKKNPRKGTFFMTKAIVDATKKHEDKLIGAMFKDVEDATEFILRNINGNNSNTSD